MSSDAVNDQFMDDANKDDLHTPSDQKIQQLVSKATEMKSQAKRNQECIEGKIKELRKQINHKVAFLHATKNQIQNIRFKMEQDYNSRDGDKSFGDFLLKDGESTEKINLDIERVKEKILKLKEKADIANRPIVIENNKPLQDDLEATFTSAIATLENISKGIYD